MFEKKSARSGRQSENGKTVFSQAGKEVSELLKKAQAKYSQADDSTKKGIITGLAAAAALIAGAIGYKKWRNK